MKLLLFILFFPIILVAQYVSEFQLIPYNKTSFKDYDFKGGIDSLKSHGPKYELVTTNLGINNGVSSLLNEWRVISDLDTVSSNSEHRLSKKAILDFAVYESEEIGNNVILREFGSGIKCDSCSFSIFDILIEDEDVKEVLENKKTKWIYAPYFQITFDGEWVMSYVTFYYKIRGEKMSSVIISLPDDYKE
jgi:hypothetical protein